MRYFFKPYVPVAQRRADANKRMAALRKKGKTIEPVDIGRRRKIADSFWGRAWCEHLESYGDYANRLPRGRTYVRNGSVCHLAIDSGRIEAYVSGSKLYSLTVRIDPLAPAKWEAFKQRCRGGIGSLIELLQGRISDEIMGVVTDRKAGLFPAPSEIRMDCDCPDHAGLCKHLAAVLYGVGARLDDAPDLLFKLRGVDHHELIEAGSVDIDAATRKRSGRRRVLNDDALGGVFGIEMDDEEIGAVAEDPNPPLPRKRAGRKTAKKKSANKKSPAQSKRPAKKKSALKKAPFRPTPAAVRRLREDLNLSRAAFARELGVSQATVGNWENATGKIKPNAKSLAALRRLDGRRA